MQTVSIQTANRHQVIVEQMIDQAQQLAAGWEKLSRKQKLQAWADWPLLVRASGCSTSSTGCCRPSRASTKGGGFAPLLRRGRQSEARAVSAEGPGRREWVRRSAPSPVTVNL